MKSLLSSRSYRALSLAGGLLLLGLGFWWFRFSVSDTKTEERESNAAPKANRMETTPPEDEHRQELDETGKRKGVKRSKGKGSNAKSSHLT
jgi:hypothetical protein